MEFIDFLKNVDFNSEYVSISIGETLCIRTDLVKREKSVPVKISSDINGFISIIQGDRITAFRPEAVTHFYKDKKREIKTNKLTPDNIS